MIAASLLTLLYPMVSNTLYEHRAESLIETFQLDTQSAQEQELSAMRKDAEAYNHRLRTERVVFDDPFGIKEHGDLSEQYREALNISETGIMAFITVPKINIHLPIYHGTDPQTLETGVGHLEGTSLPIGGESTHAVLSAHTGLNRAKLFTDLTALEVGDCFFIQVLGETLAYKEDQITIVEPSDSENLHIINGEDHITLLTCTPYGINSHRLLVRGVRTEIEELPPEDVEPEVVVTESQWAREYERALVIGISMVSEIALLVLLTQKWRKWRENR